MKIRGAISRVCWSPAVTAIQLLSVTASHATIICKRSIVAAAVTIEAIRSRLR
jgi:hypothetical protein